MKPTFQLVMRAGLTPGATYPLAGGQYVFGRDTACSIVLHDAEVSRQHARLTIDGVRVQLEDLGSTNGTYVNYKPVRSTVTLRSGDVIAFGQKTVFVLQGIAGASGSARVVLEDRRGAPPRPYLTVPVEAGSASRQRVKLMVIAGALLVLLAVWLYYAPLSFWCMPVVRDLVQFAGGVCR